MLTLRNIPARDGGGRDLRAPARPDPRTVGEPPR